MSKLKSLFLNCFSTFFIILISIIISTKLLINTNVLYYYDVTNLNIVKTSNLSIEEIKLNYAYLINYIKSNSNKDFNPPNLNSSEVSKIHFKEVTNLLHRLDIVFLFSIILFLILAYILFKYKCFSFLKWSSIFLIFIPFFLIICFVLNFNTFFTAFHHLFFNNENWIFDPDVDEVINILPQDYFMHCAMLILFLCFFIGISLMIFYLHLKIKKLSENRK